MLFRQLEYFVALARERHFGRAAASCHVSQPGLSEAIRKLESEFNVPLVRRGPNFQGLTPEGDRLVLWARRILADHDALQQEIGALQSGLTGELRLGAIPAAASTLAAVIDRFCTENPLVRVQLATNLQSTEIIERVRRFELDGGVIYPNQEDTGEFLVAPLYTEEHVLVANSELLTSQVDTIAWADAVQLPMCLLNTSMRGRELIDKAVAGVGLSLTPQLATDSIASLLAQVGAGRWATIVPQTWLRTVGVPAGASVLRLVDPTVTASVVLVATGGRPASALTRALIQSAQSVALDDLPMYGSQKF